MPIKERCSHFQGVECLVRVGTNPAPPGMELALSPGIPGGCAGNSGVTKRESQRGKKIKNTSLPELGGPGELMA